MERIGILDKGFIIVFYIVLVDGDDFNELIVDIIRGIFDGYIVLFRDLVNKNYYFFIDVLNSLSRFMNEIVLKEDIKIVFFVRDMFVEYREVEDLINIGVYVLGINKKIDEVIYYYEYIINFLK